MRTSGRTILFSSVVLGGATLLAQSSPAPKSQTHATASVSTASVGLAAERVTMIDRGLQRYVDAERVAGIVGLVMRDGNIEYEKAFGWADREAGRKMTTDSVFRIASQTKALTSTAIMQLVEEGKLALSTPAGELIPSFAKTTVAVANERGAVTQVPAKRAITIRDLLTHTAGISYGTEPAVAALYAAKGLGPSAGFGWYTADKDETVCATMERLGTLQIGRAHV